MGSLPGWLSDFANQVALEVRGHDILPPIGCHYFFDDIANRWEVTIFASSTAVVGGKRDGDLVASPFNIDLERIRDLMTEVTSCCWQSLSMGQEDELGSHLSFEGTYQEHSLWLRITAMAPNRFPSGRTAAAYSDQWKEVW